VIGSRRLLDWGHFLGASRSEMPVIASVLSLGRAVNNRRLPLDRCCRCG